MLVEALVLDRDDRVLQPRRDRARRDDDARLRAAQDREDRVPVARVDVRVRLLLLSRAGSSCGICAAIAASSPNVNADEAEQRRGRAGARAV